MGAIGVQLITKRVSWSCRDSLLKNAHDGGTFGRILSRSSSPTARPWMALAARHVRRRVQKATEEGNPEARPEEAEGTVASVVAAAVGLLTTVSASAHSLAIG